MNIIGKLLIAIGVIVGISVAFALGVATFVLGTLSTHGVHPGTSYVDDYDYEQSETILETLDASQKSLLIIDNPIGKITIRGWDNDNAEISIEKRGSSKKDLDEIKVEVIEAEDRIIIDVEHEKEVNMFEWAVDVKVQIPRHMNLNIDHSVGALRIENFDQSESITIDLGVGEAQLINLHAENISVDVGVGGIFIDNVIAENTSIDVGIGDIEFRTPFSSDYYVNASVGMGELSIEGYGIPGLQIERKGFMSRDAELKLGEGSNRLTLQVGMGDLQVRVDRDSE